MSAGQYAFRPAWMWALAGSIKLFGWSNLALAIYPAVCGSLIPFAACLWMRLYARDRKPLLACFLILTTYPTLAVDSLVLSNEIPVICWALLSVCCLAYSIRTEAAGKAAMLALLGGIAAAISMHTKVTALPFLVAWYVLEYFGCDAAVSRRRWMSTLGWLLVTPLASQLWYLHATGNFWANFVAEVEHYRKAIPKEYWLGTYQHGGLLRVYPRLLFSWWGHEPFDALLHGIWAWIFCGYSFSLITRIRSTDAAIRFGALHTLSAILLFLFFEFYPTRVFPYYLPNLFTGRIWRYMDPLAVPIAIVVSITLAKEARRISINILQTTVLIAGLLAAGWNLSVRYYEFNDRPSDLNRAAALLKDPNFPCSSLSNLIDRDGLWHLKTLLGWKDKPIVEGVSMNQLPLRQDRICLWTGGSRRETLRPPSIPLMQKKGWRITPVITLEGARTPWRNRPLQAWMVEATS